MSNKRLLTVLLVIAGLSILNFAPGIVPVAVIIGVVLSRQWKQQGRGSFLDWLAEQLGFGANGAPRKQQEDPFEEMRENAPTLPTNKPTKAHPKVRSRSRSQRVPREPGDADWYSSSDEKISSQTYIGSTGRDPWDLPPGKDPWDLPSEHPPWEK
jgi:hypothetical protein